MAISQNPTGQQGSHRRNRNCLPEIATAPLGPRNDKLGSLAPQNVCRKDCQPAWRSLSAATDAIGAYRFNGGRYGLHVQRRARLSAPQLVKKVPLDFLDKLLSELQNQILQHDFAILPLRRVI